MGFCQINKAALQHLQKNKRSGYRRPSDMKEPVGFIYISKAYPENVASSMDI